MTIKHYIILLLLFCAHTLFAQDARFTVSVSKSEVTVGEQFEVTFSLNGNADRFTPPSFNGFQVLSGPNESTNMTSINGASTTSFSIGYIVAATNVGVYNIGSASVVANGRQLTTKPLVIKVLKGSSQRSNAGQSQSAQDANVPLAASGEVAKDIFIRASVNKTKAYLGEQVNLTYKLYTRVPIDGYGVDKGPDLNGFWNQDVNKNTQQAIPMKVEEYKGSRYEVAVLKQTVLFPEREGNLTVDPLGMTFIVREQAPARDVMEQMFGGNVKQVKVKILSAPLTVHVMPLPQAGKPAGFTGAVGNFTVDASVDKKELKANEALNYKLRISGSGNIKLLKDANINPPADFEKYDPKVTDSVLVNERGVTGYRDLTYLLIPRHQGDYNIAPVQFSYYNPATNRYVTVSTKGFSIKVNKGTDGGNVTSLAPSEQRDAKLLNTDIRPIKTFADIHKESDTFFGSAGYNVLLLLGPVLFLAALGYRKQNEKYNSDVVIVKSRRAAKIAAKHMANAKMQLDAGNKEAFYEAVSKGLYGYLSDKLNIPAADLNQENIASELEGRQVDDSLIGKLTGTLDLCEMARFAPVSGVSQQEVYERARSAINDIETGVTA